MTKDKKPTADALEILHRRYIGDDPERLASLQEERVNAEVARTIYDMRTEAGLSQGELAALVGTTQSVISRLEDADYQGHSLRMLNRIARTLNQRVTVLFNTNDQGIEMVRYVFREVVRGLRRRKGLTVDQLATELDLDKGEIVAMERNPGYRPSPLALYKLSRFYGVPQQRLAALAGAVSEISDNLREQASRFAAKSDSFSKLTPDEKRELDAFVKLLKVETNK
jgi:transcriptional regulator with XRE-family HTH domain